MRAIFQEEVLHDRASKKASRRSPVLASRPSWQEEKRRRIGLLINRCRAPITDFFVT